MDIEELLNEEHNTIFGIEEINDYHSPDSYRKLTKTCSKRKIVLNSIEMYQSEQKLKNAVNTPFISKNDYADYPTDFHLTDMNLAYIFKNIKKEIFSKTKKTVYEKNKEKYCLYVSDKCFLLSLKALEEDKIKKTLILYYVAKLSYQNILTPEKIVKSLIQDEQFWFH